MTRAFLLIAFLCVIPFALASQQAHWDYTGKTGPDNWAKLSPEYRACASGQEQSPIDIHGARVDKGLKPITFGYIATAMTITNNGHTIEVTPEPGNYILYNDTRYDLVQFHFHRPSEETVRGHISDMEVHLVHKSAEGKLLVLSVRLNEGAPNAVIAPLWEKMPKKAGETAKVADELNPAGLLPVNRAYWAFQGSLTTPPCTEGVQWIAFEEEKELSREQIKAFSALYKFNARPLQNPHGRKIAAFE